MIAPEYASRRRTDRGRDFLSAVQLRAMDLMRLTLEDWFAGFSVSCEDPEGRAIPSSSIPPEDREALLVRLLERGTCPRYSLDRFRVVVSFGGYVVALEERP